MADENIDSDYHGRPYRPRLSSQEIKRALEPEEIKRARQRLRYVGVRLPDGSLAIRARGGWYAFDENKRRPDFDRPVEVPDELVQRPRKA